jgi:hypothetical protein
MVTFGKRSVSGTGLGTRWIRNLLKRSTRAGDRRKENQITDGRWQKADTEKVNAEMLKS